MHRRRPCSKRPDGDRERADDLLEQGASPVAARPAGRRGPPSVLLHLLSAMRANEEGTLRDLDTEFLHDFRVAVRRTRSALSQIKDVLPAEIEERYRAEFGWLDRSPAPRGIWTSTCCPFRPSRICCPVPCGPTSTRCRTYLDAVGARSSRS